MKFQFDAEVRKPLMIAALLLFFGIVWKLSQPAPGAEIGNLADRSARNICVLTIQTEGANSPHAKENCAGVNLDTVDRANAGLK